jgi:precorrin-2 dehydrogenase/sirohydrochlorin ferrochelatase
MRYYPIQLDILNRPCVVVGGGAVGTRKTETLLACGARVTVVSVAAGQELRDWAAQGRVTLHLRAFAPEDLDGAFLVIGATDDEDLNRRVSAEAERRGILCNIADRPDKCNFILPAVIARGDLVITVSTSGRSPAMAKHLRRTIGRQFGEEYAVLLRILGAARKRLLAQAHAPEAHKPLFEAIVSSDILDCIRSGQMEEVDRLLAQVFGEGFRAADLLREADQP